MSQSQSTKEVYIRSMIESVVGWIEDNLHSPLNANEITAKWGYSKWYTQRQFKKHSGIALMTYIRMRKMTEAAHLLEDATLSIKDVYIRFGFEDASSFNRTFKRCFGVSPTAYRLSVEDFRDKMVAPLDVERIIQSVLAN